jgi:glutamine amidotransferase
VDSALLAALVFHRGLDSLGDTVGEVAAADPAARLNLLAADGTRLLATTWGDTLSALVTDEGTALASEPWDDDPRWTDVPDRTLVEATPDGITLTPLDRSEPA